MTFWKEEGAGRQRQRHVDSSGGARGPTALSSPTMPAGAGRANALRPRPAFDTCAPGKNVRDDRPR